MTAQRHYTVDWRFISLRLLNRHLDYAASFPPDYEAGHTAGLRLLRVAARVRAAHGRDAVGPLYEAFGRHLFEVDRQPDIAVRGSREFVTPVLAEAGLPPALAAAVDDESADVEIQAETDEALTLTGKDVGTPILHFHPPEGRSFFGPVISRVPSDGLAGFPGFAELKRSLRERPQLPALGVRAAEPGVEEDWHGGSRRPEEGRLRNELPPGGAAGRMSDLLDVPVTTLQGEATTLRALTGGRAALVVNVASRCGLTPQYGALEGLQREYGDRGLTVVGVPCNQFQGQEPGSAEEIAEFCSATYGVTFPMTEKLDVNGPGAHPLFQRLTSAPDADGTAGDVRWNFEKWLVDADGEVVARFRPQTEPDAAEVRHAIEQVLTR